MLTHHKNLKKNESFSISIGLFTLKSFVILSYYSNLWLKWLESRVFEDTRHGSIVSATFFFLFLILSYTQIE